MGQITTAHGIGVVVDGATSIHNRTFCRCFELRSVTSKTSVRWQEAFAWSDKQKSITAQGLVETIVSSAFYGCTISSFKIPRSVVFFGKNPFSNRTCLKEIDVLENLNFVFVDGVLIDKGMTQIINCDPSKKGDYSILITVAAIGNGAFTKCSSLTSIALPESVKEIGYGALAFCHCLVQ